MVAGRKIYWWLLWALCALAAIDASAERLDPSAVEHLGSFGAPAWGAHGNVGITLIPDCMGRSDPSPADGYPGCVGAFENVNARPQRFGIYELVPPGHTAREVVAPWDLSAGLPQEILGPLGSEQHFDAFYEAGPPCRLWWTYGTWFTRVSEDLPFLGYSSCDPSDPAPQGMWEFGDEQPRNVQGDPYHSAKMFKGISEIPSSVAGELFEGRRMLLNTGRESGTRGGSQGPSAYVRPMTVPASSPAHDAIPLLWYHLTRYVTETGAWTDVPEMSGGAMRHWPAAGARGMEIFDVAGGRAAVVPWYSPIVDSSDYPCSDPSNPYTGRANTPEPCQVPVCWYGVDRCTEGLPDHLQPSFWDRTREGAHMPPDCRIRVAGNQTPGPKCLSMRGFLLLYDVDELAGVYRGELAHNEPQPYAAVPIPFVVPRLTGGTTSDGSRLYVALGGPTPRVHIFSIGSTPPPEPPPPEPPPPARELELEAAKGVVIYVRGLEAGAEADIYAGIVPGEHSGVGGCPVGIASAVLIATGRASEEGEFVVSLRIAEEASGRVVLLQAIERQTCVAAPIEEVRLP